jgi:predicted dehydrogenase
MSRVRWGILGAAEIARKNWKAIHGSGNGLVTAVASREVDRSRSFIEQCQAEAPFEAQPKAFGSYSELLNSETVDAVYVPLPTGRRKDVVLAAASTRKHVICEKPCAVTVPELRTMLDCCRENRVQFMDGVMFVHSQRWEKILEVIRGEEGIGQFHQISSAFSFRAPPEFLTANIRAHSELEPLGCLGDLGWYCIRLILAAFHWRMPRYVSGRLLAELARRDSPASVPADFAGQLLFENGVSAGFSCSFLAEIAQWAVISGTEGYLRVPDFVLPFAGAQLGFELVRSRYHVQGCDFTMEAGARQFSVSEFSHGHPNSQESRMFRNFNNQVLSGQLNESWPEAALQTQIVLAACLESSRNEGRLVRVGSTA